MDDRKPTYEPHPDDAEAVMSALAEIESGHVISLDIDELDRAMMSGVWPDAST